MLKEYDSFSAFATEAFYYILGDKTITLSLIGILILYFGYFSSRSMPIRTERLRLYLSGFQFLSTYFILQIFFLYYISKYLTPVNLISLLSLIFLFIPFYYIFHKIQDSISTLIFKLVAVILFLYIVPKLIWEHISQIEYLNWILFFLIWYHASMVIQSKNIKEFQNDNSYDYKDFYSKISQMNILQYPFFLHPLKMVQRKGFEIFFNQKEDAIKKENVDANITLLEILAPILKIFGVIFQTATLQTEIWINSLLTLIFVYMIIIYSKISLIMGLFLSIYLFFALTSIAIEYSISTNGFVLIKVFPKIGKPFRCRLMEMDEKQIKVLLKGESADKFNPLEHYPINEISKIRYVSFSEMIDET